MRENGAIIIGDRQVASTLRCCHCGSHWTPKPGSGIERGFCLKCMNPTCGHRDCDPCIPFEAWLEHQEGKKTVYTEAILARQAAGGM